MSIKLDKVVVNILLIFCAKTSYATVVQTECKVEAVGAQTISKYRLVKSYACSELNLNYAVGLETHRRKSEHLQLLEAKDRAEKQQGENNRCVSAEDQTCMPLIAVAKRRAYTDASAPFIGDISYYASQYNIDPDLLHAIAYVESGYNSSAVSPKGALGLMQIMPATARHLGHVGSPRELHDPSVNIELACIYLRELYRSFGNDLPLVLAAYNAGPHAVKTFGRRIPPYAETQAYVRNVMDRYLTLRTL
jgi:soluble lytic murein transglycosylase-like protein